MDRMRVRTDLALEARESFDGSDTEVHGVVVEEEYEEALDLKITRVKILSERGVKASCGQIRHFQFSDFLNFRSLDRSNLVFFGVSRSGFQSACFFQ